MNDLEHLSIELWAEESGTIKWTMLSNLNPVIDRKLVERMILEFAETAIDIDQEDNRVILNIICQKQGMTTTRWDPAYDFTPFGQYLWVKSNLYRAHWHMFGRKARPGILYLFWAVGWFYHTLVGHFKRSESMREAAATPVPATPAKQASDLSEGLVGPSQVGGGTVLPFRRPR